MEAYLDNSATTRCSEVVLEKMNQVYREDFGNPSAMHQKGVDAERQVRNAREIIARTLKVNEKEIYFTSGGTESNNLAIIGTALANQRAGKHIITTSFEHASVANTMHFLEDSGFSVTYLPVHPDGSFHMEALRNVMTKDTILVSVMHVNNEIGSVAPLEEIGAYIKEVNPDVVYHVDAIQSYGKFQIRPKKAKIDLLSVSAHKIHGPKGVGFLYVKEKTKIRQLFYGGGQQDGLRSGTENVPGIAGLAVAAAECYQNFEEKIERLYALRERFIAGVCAIDGVQVNGPQGREGAPQIVSISVQDVRSEVLLHALEDRGVYVSAGSACSTHKRAASATLTAIGVAPELLESTLRISLAYTTTEEEVDYALVVLGELIPTLRKFTRKM